MDKTSIKYLQNFSKDVGRTIHKHKLIEENDRILVGLSGGKDSLVLLETLADRKKYFPFSFELIPVHIHVANLDYSVDFKFLETFCRQFQTSLIIKETIIDFNENPKKSPCFVCSWHRRKTLFKLTKELHCNKLALGHHLDDAIETQLMNMIYHGSISSMPQKLSMFGGRVNLIRPLLLHTRDEIQKYADIRQFPKEIKICPHSDKTRREEVKNLISMMVKMNKKS